MTSPSVSRQIESLQRAMGPFIEFVTQSSYARARAATDRFMADFVAGNPQEMALPGFVEALRRWSVPRDKDWFSYKTIDRGAQQAAAASLTAKLGLTFEPDDIFLARGAGGALAVALRTVVDPGDEVVFVSPPWFFYEAMIIAAGAAPVKVRIDEATFDLDVDAIARALSPRTRAVVINTPHNPTGKIYPKDTLTRLAAELADAGERNGRPIYLLSDEAYNRILFDDQTFFSPGLVYPYTFLIQTYSKTALAPGQRLGCIALPPTMPDREAVRRAMLLVAFGHGYLLPDAVMQYALADIDALSIDLKHLERKRDRVVKALREQGYHLHVPAATFYLLPKSPVPDDRMFTEMLASRDVFVLPGTAVEMPGYFRLSLTATDEMIDFALPQFASALGEVVTKTR
ncbi:MAG TPA: aminotransferase class I/II-fold pyridoxal phosphate-dependent enzyme [bacterium]|nr:aminotransferase class I/II-fold pyridoxal phosphate-dependent enzyme [bacterium]